MREFGFARPFRLWNRLFPGVGVDVSQNAVAFVSDVVNPTADLFRLPFLNDAFLFTNQVTIAGLAVGQNQFAAFPGPTRGRAHLPILITVEQPDAATRTGHLVLNRVNPSTGDPDDDVLPWSAAVAAQVSASQLRQPVSGVATPNHIASPVPVLVYHNNLQLTIFPMTGGNNATATYYALDLPFELVTLETFRAMHSPNFIFNTAI